MKEVKWTQAMSVHEATIDKQHKNLLNQIEKIRELISTEKDIDMDAVREAMHFLYTYAHEHISYEEGYLKQYNYPEFEKHKKAHNNFIQFYDDFQKEFKEKFQAKGFSSSELKQLIKKIEEYLAMWWVGHIEQVDSKYAKYIAKHKK